jgi:hypothetical protein
MPTERIKLPPDLPRGTKISTGKGWRLVNPKKSGTLKAALAVTFYSAGQRFAIFRIVR